MTVREYAWLRVERLYPLLAIGSALGVGVWMLGYSDFVPVNEADRVRALIGQFTMVPYLSSATGLAFDAALWSISFELLANVVHALVYRRLDMLRLVALIVASFVVLVFMGHRFGSLDIGWSSASAMGGIGRVLFGFFVGVRLHRTEAKWRPLVPSLPFAAVGLMLMVVVNAPIRSHDWGNWSTLYNIAAVSVAMPVLVMLGVAAHGARRGALFLGVLSFPIYAIHVPLVTAMRLAGWSTGTRLAGVVVIALGAWVLGRYVDEPLNAWRRASRKRGRPAGGQAIASAPTMGAAA